jgi:hypothetical protein
MYSTIGLNICNVRKNLVCKQWKQKHDDEIKKLNNKINQLELLVINNYDKKDMVIEFKLKITNGITEIDVLSEKDILTIDTPYLE